MERTQSQWVFYSWFARRGYQEKKEQKGNWLRLLNMVHWTKSFFWKSFWLALVFWTTAPPAQEQPRSVTSWSNFGMAVAVAATTATAPAIFLPCAQQATKIAQLFHHIRFCIPANSQASSYTNRLTIHFPLAVYSKCWCHNVCLAN